MQQTKRFKEFQVIWKKMCISEQYNKIIEAVYEVRKTFLKPPKQKSQYWFDSEDGQKEELIDTRSRAWKEYLQTKLQEQKNWYNKSKAIVRQVLRTMENNFRRKNTKTRNHMQTKAILTNYIKKF